MIRAIALARRARASEVTIWRSPAARLFASTAVSRAKPTSHSAAESKGGRRPIVSKTGQVIEPREFDALISRKLFFVPAFEPYKGIEGVELRGLYCYGPPGANLQDNVLDVWRRHFILEEDMLKVDCPAITPYEVFKTSGHVEKFTDYMCRDVVTGEHYRADHLVKEELEGRVSKLLSGKTTSSEALSQYKSILSQLDNKTAENLDTIIIEQRILSPAGNRLKPPKPVNLMFETAIGPSGKVRGYLRPETAQGQFLMFRELLDYNHRAMPFASASIGKAYRNEISPKSGILRVREFLMAEIEHFMDPEASKVHPLFSEVADCTLPLLTREEQMLGRDTPASMAIADAVAKSIVDNETLGYFLARTHLFLVSIGIDPSRTRLRQHMSDEMAHYAVDCWDVELLTSYGWIECVGLADRSAFDLTAHSKRTGEQLEVRHPLGRFEETEHYKPILNMKALASQYKQDRSAILAAIMALSQAKLVEMSEELDRHGRTMLVVPNASTAIESGQLELDRGLISGFERKVSKKEAVRLYTPNVIEPSFGIGRIVYALMEHSIDRRAGDDEARLVLSFPPKVAPTTVLIVPLQLNIPQFVPLSRRIQRMLRQEDVSTHIDATKATIGKRYCRNDEVGTPLAITIDFQSLEDETVTLRDRDSMRQVRGSADVVCGAAVNILRGREQWEDVYRRLPAVESK